MYRPDYPYRHSSAKPSWERKQARVAVEFFVLTGIVNIEPGGPERHSSAENNRRPRKPAGQRHPDTDWSHAKTKPQYEVRRQSVALRDRVPRQERKKRNR